MQIKLKNGHIMVKEVKREDDVELSSSSGIIIPKETLDDEQASQGLVIKSDDSEYPVNSTVLFHKTLPIDVNMKLDGDEKMQVYFFINVKDVICVIEN